MSGITPVTDPVELAKARKAMDRQPFVDAFWKGWTALPPGTKVIVNGKLYYKMANQLSFPSEEALFEASTGLIWYVWQLFQVYEGFEPVQKAIVVES